MLTPLAGARAGAGAQRLHVIYLRLDTIEWDPTSTRDSVLYLLLEVYVCNK